jgi:hypothetical protein
MSPYRNSAQRSNYCEREVLCAGVKEGVCSETVTVENLNALLKPSGG